MSEVHSNIKVVNPPKKGNYRERPPEGCMVLFLAANPKDSEMLSLTKEFNAVQDNCPHNDDVWKLKPRFDITPKEILPLLLPPVQGKPAVAKILHFSGHGMGTDGLMLTDEEGYSQLVTTDSLATLLQNFSDSISCVVLNACYSEEQAKIIAQYIPNVIGTDNAIDDDKAIEFSEAFYLCLFRGETYENAFKMALAQVGIQNLSKGAQPILYRWSGDGSEAVKIELPKKETPKPVPAPTANNTKLWAGLGIVLLLVVALFASNFMGNSDTSFALTVLVHGKDGKDHQILKNQGKVMLDIGTARQEATINERGEATFKELPATFIGKEALLSIEHDQPYLPTNRDATYLLEKDKAIYLEVELKGLNKLKGSVWSFDTEEPLDSVRVSVENISVYTNESGWFELNIPPGQQAKFVNVTFHKKGYHTEILSDIAPHTKQEIQQMLTKK